MRLSHDVDPHRVGVRERKTADIDQATIAYGGKREPSSVKATSAAGG